MKSNVINNEVFENLDSYLFQKLLDNFPDSIYFKDLESRFIRVNKQKLHRSHVQNDEDMLGKTDFDFFDTDRAQDAFNDEQEIIRTGKPLIDKIEKNIFPGSNEINWVITNKVAFEDKQGKIIGTMGISRNITDLVEKERKLSEYQHVIKTMTEWVWISTPHGEARQVNESFLKLLWYTESEVLWKGFWTFWKWCTRLKKENCIKCKSHSETTITTKTGENIPVLISCTPLSDGGVARMITDLREVRAIQDHANRLQELNAMKDEFVSIVSHELRTPMTIIRGYTELMLDGDMGKIPKRIQEPLEKITKETGRLIEIINDVLDASKLESWNMTFSEQPFPLDKLLKEIQENFKIGIALKHISYNYFLDEKIRNLVILLDENKLRQVLLNLVGNALKFTPENGSIEIYINKKEEWVEIHIKDSGVGIPKEKQNGLFEKFRQIDNYLQKSTKWSGLGLYICKKILENYNIPIDFISEEGKGSEFFFTIPEKYME